MSRVCRSAVVAHGFSIDKNHTRYEHNRCKSGDKESGRVFLSSTTNILFAVAVPDFN